MSAQNQKRALIFAIRTNGVRSQHSTSLTMHRKQFTVHSVRAQKKKKPKWRQQPQRLNTFKSMSIHTQHTNDSSFSHSYSQCQTADPILGHNAEDMPAPDRSMVLTTTTTTMCCTVSTSLKSASIFVFRYLRQKVHHHRWCQAAVGRTNEKNKKNTRKEQKIHLEFDFPLHSTRDNLLRLSQSARCAHIFFPRLSTFAVFGSHIIFFFSARNIATARVHSGPRTINRPKNGLGLISPQPRAPNWKQNKNDVGCTLC